MDIGAGDGAVGGAGLEFMGLDPERGAGPVDGGAADGLDDPGGQVGEVLVDAPGAGGGAHVGPGELGEAGPFVVDEILVFDAVAGLEDDGLDALLGELVAERAAARAGADDDDEAVVVQVESSHAGSPC